MPADQFRFVVITDYREAYQKTGYVKLPPQVQYIGWGHEICPTTKRPHLQVFAYGEKMTEARWRILFGKSHVECMRGDWYQNEKYCSKEGTLKEIGLKPMHRGKKRCLQDYTDEIFREPKKRVGAHVDADNAPVFVQYRRGLEALQQELILREVEKDRSAPQVIHIYGPPRTGKTYFAWDKEADLFDVSASDGYKWKDGYQAHEAVLFDNVSSDAITDRNRFLKEIDRYPVRASIKGGFVMWKPKRIYITTLESPAEFARVFQDPREYIGRVTSVIQYTGYLKSREIPWK